MSGGTGKRPAATRGQVRYNRRDVPPDRAAAAGRAVVGPPPARTSPPVGPRPAAVSPGTAVRPPAPPIPVIVGHTQVKVEPATPKKNRRALSGSPGAAHAPERPVAPRDPAPAAETPPAPPRTRRGLLAWRRPNRRVTVESRSVAVWIGDQLAALARRLLIVGKITAALAVLVAALAAGRLAIQHVVASPRFALRDVRVGETAHVSRDDIVALSTVQLGDRLLALDTDVIAARLARHPWIAAARVRRQLPSTLVIDVTERRAAAVAIIGGLYLIDERGHPFKHATLDEADGQVVLTGISRAEYAGLPRASEAAFREALALLSDYQHPDSLAAARQDSAGSGRPALSEIHIDPRTGFSLFLYEGGAEVRLGRGALPEKLARLDEILAEFGPRGLSALRVVHLDGPSGDRVPIRLAAAPGGAGADTAAAPLPPNKNSLGRVGGGRAR